MAVSFDHEADGQKLIIKSSVPIEYGMSTDAKGNAVVKLKNAKLAPMLERTLDVTDFDGIISSISSYQKGENVSVEIDVERQAVSDISRNKNQLQDFES